VGAFSALSSLFNLGGTTSAMKRSEQEANAKLQQGIDLTKQQQGANTAAYDPYTSAGAGATNSIAAMLGLSGQQAQQQSLDAIKSNPLFTSQYQTGIDSILQNASATGGLRGGNTDLSLARFGSQLYGSTYQQLLANMFGLSNQGLGATESVQGLNSGLTGSIASMLGTQGQNTASRILGVQQAKNATANTIGGWLDASPSSGQTNAGGIAGMFGGGSPAPSSGGSGNQQVIQAITAMMQGGMF
jgi:hypothetical protein